MPFIMMLQKMLRFFLKVENFLSHGIKMRSLKDLLFRMGDFFEEFVLVDLSQDEAKLMADEYLAEWDQDIEEENDW